MLIGAHVSIEGGLRNAPRRAGEIGLECFQFFSRPPQGGPASPVTDKVAAEFLRECEATGQRAWYIHTPYVINLASREARTRHSSTKLIREDLERGAKLKATAVVTHIGSASGVGEEAGLKLAAEGLRGILDGYRDSTKLLLELSAGSGMVIGDTFEELSRLIALSGREDLGICLDTAHAFASGYDLRGAEAVKSIIDAVDYSIGLDRLGLIHANDSVTGLGERKDRHEHIGLGKIGPAAFKQIMKSPRLRDIDVILETPQDEMFASDVKKLFRMRDSGL